MNIKEKDNIREINSSDKPFDLLKKRFYEIILYLSLMILVFITVQENVFLFLSLYIH